jgi:hypothetical protein
MPPNTAMASESGTSLAFIVVSIPAKRCALAVTELTPGHWPFSSVSAYPIEPDLVIGELPRNPRARNFPIFKSSQSRLVTLSSQVTRNLAAELVFWM